MRTFIILETLLIALLLSGCSKPQDCSFQHAPGTVTTISGPDSLQAGAQNTLTLGVSAPGLCVSDIKVNISRYSDTVYYVDADVKYSAGANNNCTCEVKDLHYVRVYFSSPVMGTIYLTSVPGFSVSAAHSIKVY